MSTRKTIISNFVLSAALVLSPSIACDESGVEPSNPKCPTEAGPFPLDRSRIAGTVEFDPPEDPLGRGDTLVLAGTAFHEDGLAIREVRVAGALAQRDAFNFGRWTASISYEAIVSSAPTTNGQVTLEAVAVDACGVRYPFARFVVPVDPTPDIDVASLSLAVEYPSGLDFIPASGAVPAIVTVTGTGRAVGASVQVALDAGDARGLDDVGQLVLAGTAGQLANGSASFLYYGSRPGTATLIATAEDKLAVALVTVAGPPALAPRLATLTPGSAIAIGVSGEGDISCVARASSDLPVTWDEVALDIEPTLIERDADGRRELLAVASLEPTVESVEVVVTCSDAFGQSGTGRYTLDAAGYLPPPPDDEEPFDDFGGGG